MAVVWPQMNQFGVARRGAATEESSKLEAGVSARGVADAHLFNGSAFMHLTKPEKERRWIHIFLFVTLFCEWSLFPGWRWSSDSDAERKSVRTSATWASVVCYFDALTKMRTSFSDRRRQGRVNTGCFRECRSLYLSAFMLR